MTNTDAYVVTIDGPGGSGKGSLARNVASTLGFHLLDSGAIYRLLGLKAIRSGVDLDAPRGARARVLGRATPLTVTCRWRTREQLARRG